MRQSSVIWHECRSIWGISFHNDLSSVFKVIQALQGGIFVFAVANAALVKDADLSRHLYYFTKSVLSFLLLLKMPTSVGIFIIFTKSVLSFLFAELIRHLIMFTVSLLSFFLLLFVLTFGFVHSLQRY